MQVSVCVCVCRTRAIVPKGTCVLVCVLLRGVSVLGVWCSGVVAHDAGANVCVGAFGVEGGGVKIHLTHAMFRELKYA